MKSSSIIAFASAVVGASAWNYNVSTTWTTDVVTAFTTVCPAATVLTYGEHTYTVTEATTLTITNCPCTISKPVIVTSSVYCQSCAQSTVYPNVTSTYAPAPVVPTYAPTYVSTNAPASIPTAGADRAVAFSGAALAGLVGLAAFAL